MKLFTLFRTPQSKSAAETAKERLQIVVAHERVGRGGPDYLPMLQKELMAVIAKYINIDEKKVAVSLDRRSDITTLEVDIELPEYEKPKTAAVSAA